MEANIDSRYGNIAISTDAIATYVGTVAVSSFGIVGMAAYSMKDGLVHLLKKDSNSLKRGINVKIKDNGISLVLHCIVSYGISIPAISENLIANVRYKLEEFTGMHVDRIDVRIEGIRVID